MTLLTPGPCMTSEAVRQAMAVPDLNHRAPEYVEAFREVRAGLVGLAAEQGGDHEVRLIGGSGSAAMEAMVTSCIEKGPALVLANGYYSERLAAFFEIHRIPHQVLRFDWLRGWDLDQVEAELKTGGFEAVLGVHHETTTGRLNRVPELVSLAERFGVRVLVDAVSSFPADPLPFAGVHAACSSANKCLHGLPGVSFVFLRRDFVPVVDAVPRRTYYLSLAQYAGENPPHTPPIPAVLALREALRALIKRGGGKARGRRYAHLVNHMREGLAERGYSFAVPTEESSCTLVTASLPDGSDYETFFQKNYRNRYVIYGCKGELANRFFQASVMGELSDAMIDGWLMQLPPASRNSKD